jgi:hypothetical protein
VKVAGDFTERVWGKEVCMRDVRVGVLILLLAGFFAACENPFVIGLLPDRSGMDSSVPVITITKQPAEETNVTEGDISGSLTVTASVTKDITLGYQWFSNNEDSNTGGNIIEGAESAEFLIPDTITEGTYYYFCEVSAEGAVSVRSNVAVVIVAEKEEELTPIYTAAVTVTAPVKGAFPDLNIINTADLNYTCTDVLWMPEDEPFLGGVIYTVTVVLSAEEGFAFVNNFSATINGQTADIIYNNGSTAILDLEFPVTLTKEVTGMEIKEPPDNLTYTHGDILDLSGLIVTLTFEDDIDDTEDIETDDFWEYGLTVIPSDGAVLSHTLHNDKPVEVKYGSHTLLTDNLTVYKKNLTVTGAMVTKQYDGTNTVNPDSGTIIFSGIVNGESVSVTGITAEYTGVDAGTTTINISSITLDNDNYTVTIPVNNITVTGGITKANGAEVSGASSILSLPAVGSIIVSTVTIPDNPGSQTVEYAVSESNDETGLSEWQASTTFSGLTSGTDYYIYARSAENKNYNAGTVSVSETVSFSVQSFPFQFVPPVDNKPIVSGITISQSGFVYPAKAKMTITNPDDYDSVEWKYGSTLLGSSWELELDAADLRYNIIGTHNITVVVWKDNEPYNRIISFEVVQ